VTAYRDSFRLLLDFAHQRLHKRPIDITIEDLDAPFILDFLRYLEEDRRNSIRSRNARFAAMVAEHGITFIGPTPEHLSLMGDKVRAKEAAVELGLPIVPGSEGMLGDDVEAMSVADRIGYPVLVKAAAGGGGKGMKVANNRGEMAEALALARAEAKAHFGNDALYLEKYLSHPRHIEIQVLADMHGNAVHLGERDCSLQRRHQKVLEEALSPALNAAQRAAIGDTVVLAMKKLGYQSVGTVEFLFQDGAFYFIEMNTRLQVEHPISEMITDIDLVREQIRVATGAPLGFTQSEISFLGHAIECRINAEDPFNNFQPCPGRIEFLHVPGGHGVRVDTHVYAGYVIPPYYDSMIAKLICYGRDRRVALDRMARALDEFIIRGIKTTIPLHKLILKDPNFRRGRYSTSFVERLLAASQPLVPPKPAEPIPARAGTPE